MISFIQTPSLCISCHCKWRKLDSTSSLSMPAARHSRSSSCSFSCTVSRKPIRYAVLGAGFAGLSVAWNLLQKLQHGSMESNLSVDIYDEVGIGGGASGVAGGLLHPYSPKVKLLWRGADCWKESLNLLNVAEAALRKGINKGSNENFTYPVSSIVRRRGILRSVVNLKSINIMTENAQNCLANCRIESIQEDAARNLVPNLSAPFNIAFYMPDTLNVDAQSYLEGLYLACQNLANDKSTMGHTKRKLNLFQKSVPSLQEITGDYDAVVICLGARAAFLPELSAKLPLRMCRGVIANLQLGDSIRETFPEHSPSILSDAWIAVRGARRIDLGSTWDWKSRNYSRNVSAEEAYDAIQVLLPKASTVYPTISNWSITGAVAGLRAMPPHTLNGTLPLLGCIDDFVGCGHKSKYWLFTGLGARGLLYHGWLGKLLALAVLSRDENLLPLELISWKHNKV